MGHADTGDVDTVDTIAAKRIQSQRLQHAHISNQSGQCTDKYARQHVSPPARSPARAHAHKDTDTQIACFSCPARQSELCRALDDTHIKELFAIAHRTRIQKGQYLFMEEAPSKYVYNLSHGAVMLERVTSEGQRQVIAFSYPGDFVGLMVGENYNMAACALTPVQVCRWNMRDLERLFGIYPVLGRQMRIISNRVLAMAIDQIFILGRKNANEKLASFLLQNCQRQNKTSIHEMDIPLICLPMSRTDIADHLGMTIETTSRAFSKFVNDGLIRRKTHTQIEIIDVHGLETAAESYPV